MNKWILTGRIVKSPETKQFEAGIVSIIHVATRRAFKSKKTNEYESDFFMLKAFGKTADYIHSHISKGDLVEVEITLTNNNYDKEGQKVYRDEYIIRTIQKLGSSKKGDYCEKNRSLYATLDS